MPAVSPAALDVDRALERVLAAARPLGVEAVPLAAACGRVLGEDVLADRDSPPFDRSAMDGWAVRVEDLEALPRSLPVSGQVRAGSEPAGPLAPGSAVQVMTGAPVPAGANAVLPVERSRPAGDGRVELLELPAAGAHIARRGSEVRAGERVLEAGRRLSPAQIAVLAAFGVARVPVGRRPRVAYLVTGDELVPVEATPRGAQIRNSNGPGLEQQIREAGGAPWCLGVAPDELESTAAALRPGLEGDVLLVSGGVSAGVYDLVEDAFARFGVEVLFDRVAVKPGAPLVFGRRGRCLVFGLPGNPVSAQVTFELFARPALLRLQGARAVSRPRLEAELLGPLRNRSQRRAHLPVRLRFESGRALAEPIRSRGSADLVAHARADALAVLEAERTEAAAGERVTLLLLDGFGEERSGAA
jgi:molybdopterin molybdotransferase